MPTDTPRPNLSPMLAGFAVPRTGGTEMAGRYSPEREVWVVDHNGSSRPIVDLRSDIAETHTVTKVRSEQDDTDISPVIEMTTRTSTAVAAEVDDRDQDRAAKTLLMVTTKTHAQLERDDVAPTFQSLEVPSSFEFPAGGISIH